MPIGVEVIGCSLGMILIGGASAMAIRLDVIEHVIPTTPISGVRVVARNGSAEVVCANEYSDGLRWLIQTGQVRERLSRGPTKWIAFRDGDILI